jgi:hypothetical protein
VQRLQTTVIALVGRRARDLVEAVGADANARAVLPEADGDPLDRAVAAWAAARRSHTPFLLHDADPLAAVADAWVGYYDEAAPVGGLEVAVSATLQRWRAGTLDLPDHYLVVDADTLAPTRRHFYLGYLHRAAPTRVVPAAGVPDAVRAAVAGLRAGRWWADLDVLLADVERVAPDRVGGAGEAALSPPP